MFGEMLGGKGYSGEQERDWMKDLEEDPKAFGIKFEGWREAAQKVGRWFRRVEEGAELFMRKWHKDCLLYTSPSPRDKRQSRMPSSA